MSSYNSVNKVILVGRLGKDPEQFVTQNNRTRCKMVLATNHSFQDKEGQWQETTTWHPLTVWGKQAERCAQFLTKGSQVFVEGHISRREYTDPQGEKKWFTEVVGQRVIFLRGVGGTDSGSGPAGAPAERAAQRYELPAAGAGQGPGAPRPRAAAADPLEQEAELPF